MQRKFYPVIFKYLLIPASNFNIPKKGIMDFSSRNKEICFKKLFKAETRKDII